MKLKLKSKRSNFDIIKASAIEAAEKVEQFEAAGAKLSAKAYVAATLEMDPNATMQRVKKLRQFLESAQPGLDNVRSTLRRMLAEIRSGHWRSPPTKYPERLRTMTTERATAELLRIHCSTVELFAVAAQICAEANPEVFGDKDSMQEIAEERKYLEARRDALFKRLGEEVATEDLNISATDPRAPVTFKASNGQVSLAPVNDAGKRLVSYLMAQREQQGV